MIIELNEAHIGDTVYVTGAYIGGYKKADTFEEINAVFQFVSIVPSRIGRRSLPVGVSGFSPSAEMSHRCWSLVPAIGT
mgnify:CR=1 FL=1